MNLLVSVVCLLALSCDCLSEVDDQAKNSIPPTIIFPKDRTHYPLPRIIGGEIATPHSHPYQVALYVYMATGAYFCGGTLIAPNWVLTAAHCISENPTNIVVILGSHDLTAQEPSRLTLNASSYVYHEGWNSTTLQHDIGLVELPINVTLSENITTIGYARGGNSFADETGTIAGWGLTEQGGNSISPVLRHVNVSIIDNEKCATMYPSLIVNSHLCTSGTGIVGSCSGDSGGPLILDGVQIGIVSFGTANCTLEYPSVFARVTYYSDWIAQYVPAGSDTSSNVSLVVLGVLCILQLIVTV